MEIELAIPDYTSLAKRAAKLGIALDVRRHRGAIDVVVDSTGLKVFGEGEWKMRKHGKSKRRTWRKLHLAVNPETQEIVAETLTENSCDDASQVDPLLNQVPNPTKRFYGDGAYDKWKVYKTLEQRKTRAIIPPQRNAKIKQHGNAQRPPAVSGHGHSGNPSTRTPALEGARRLSPPQPLGNGDASNEVLLWRPSQKPPAPESTS